MADIVGTISVAGIESSIRTVSSQVADLSSQVSSMNYNLTSDISKLKSELEQLAEDFRRMAEDQKKANSMQQAITELVRVRQEINQRYNNYSVVRETMIGVLQATDVALVKKDTISRVSEELMLSTPSYWLAPCLVAVAAWISNDRDLADRAIQEAMKRDDEKTSLAMALICRRNNRIDTCYEWLSIYFSKQKATSITEETFTYIDAYINGVFGPDRKQVCSGYVSKWIDEIRGNRSDFETSQEQKWADYCATFKVTGNPYPDLTAVAEEAGVINDCLGTIRSYQPISNNFRGITEAYVDEEELKATIDEKLIQLISNYDRIEVSIRREEEYLTLVKAYDGDEERAKAEMAVREARRQQKKLDFIEQMSNEITNENGGVPSKRRTAVTFLSNYINRGYDRFIDETLEKFPQEIRLKIDKWSGTSRDGTELETLSRDYESKMDELRKKDIEYATDRKPKQLRISAIVMFVLAVACLFIPGTAKFILAGLCAVTGGILLLSSFSSKKHFADKIRSINDEYSETTAAGKTRLANVLGQWQAAREAVEEYRNEGEHKIVA